ncbi:hypothetical protein FRACYDRAFT_241006 [Fragilariopsis cylindrus CCMP1102]|uniref:B30.2/SPRY domain-containing protein n=1 Tax=Fragilariopsis cylindrus CCMP1102 TaxID=635003 RepID=A0A1E7F8F8_9STRA|nr:hypothetical protein FRACYDRAFT_241006 [Fragilariopsis cylindrus CCMP1102]|eukprot:OEU14461.1 hypothetical protein FRACYDRAFT_241006 [Fragilariopsis cylindrus CCMP1102]
MEDGSNSDINNSMTRKSNDTSTGDNNTMNSVVGGRRGESSITDIAAADDDQHQYGSSVTVTRDDNKIQFSKVNGEHFVACKPSLNASSDEGSFWKVTIDEMPEDHIKQWVFLGIIGSLGASYNSRVDPTSYGWSGKPQVWHEGSIRDGDSGWTRFTRGECLHFHLKSNKLTMFSVQKNKKFVIDIDTTVPAYYSHFNILYVGTKVTLEPLGEDECERILDPLLNSS